MTRIGIHIIDDHGLTDGNRSAADAEDEGFRVLRIEHIERGPTVIREFKSQPSTPCCKTSEEMATGARYLKRPSTAD